jgi:Rrf2 family protein
VAHLSEEAIARQARLDGTYILRANTNLEPAEIARVYRQLWHVERAFRDLKGPFQLRPMRHFVDRRIRGHVIVCFLAYALEMAIRQGMGLAEARAGKRGGYMLLRDPAAISLLEVVEAAEGVLRAKRCTLRGGPCQWEQMCPLHPAWERATMAFRESLRQASLAEVAAVDVALEEGTAEILPTSHRLHPKADMV